MRRILTFLFLMLVVPPVGAQTRLEFDLCNGKAEPDLAILGCTSIIQKGEAETHPVFYKVRAFAYFEKGLYAKATADWTKVIALDPQDHTTYVFRGYAYEKNRQRNEAIADYRRGLKLNPRDSSAARSARNRLKALGAAP